MPAFVLYPGRIENGMRRILLRIHFLSTSEKTRIFGASRATRQGHFKTSSTGDENAPTVYTVSRARKQHESHAIVHYIYMCQNYWSPVREIKTCTHNCFR